MYGVDINRSDRGDSQIISEESDQTICKEEMEGKICISKEDIEKDLKHTTRFIIEREYVPAVIGPGGKIIEAWAVVYEVDIISIREDGQVVIIGSQQGCESAKETIESMIQRWDTAKKDYSFCEEKFKIPADLVCHVVGKNFSNLNRIKSAYNVHVNLKSAIVNGQREIGVIGFDAGKVSAAKVDILKNLPRTLRFDIDESYFGKIVGHEGENVARLSKDYGVKITLEKGKACIEGRNDRTLAARDAILSIISAAKSKKIDAIVVSL